MEHKTSWPLFGHYPEVLRPPHPGAFGVERRHDIHTGIDLYCEPGQRVGAVEDGEVVEIEIFTGPRAESPWWNETQALLVEGESGVVLYGEIAVREGLQVGDRVLRREDLGTVQTVLKKDKGLPMTMLHFELYEKGTRESVWWRLGEEQPANLKDPTFFLNNSGSRSPVVKQILDGWGEACQHFSQSDGCLSMAQLRRYFGDRVRPYRRFDKLPDKGPATVGSCLRWMERHGDVAVVGKRRNAGDVFERQNLKVLPS